MLLLNSNFMTLESCVCVCQIIFLPLSPVMPSPVFVVTIHDLGLAQTLSGVKSGEITTSLEAVQQSSDVVEFTQTAVIR